MSFLLTKITIIAIIISNSIKKILTKNEDLRLIFSFIRHGARSPSLKNNDLDIINEKWINGPYQLTLIGQRQLFLLGNLFRKKYNSFIKENYSPSEIYLMSTDNDRTLMSGNYFLLGLFSKENNKINFNEKNLHNSFPPFENNFTEIKELSENLGNNKININNIQLFPIHTIEEKDRLSFFWKECPLISNILEENLKKKEILDNIINFKDNFSKDLINILNVNENYFLNHKNIVKFCDSLFADIYDDRKLDIFHSTKINLAKLNNSCFETLKIDNIFYWGGNKEMNLVYSTSLLIKLLNSLKTRIEINIKNYKNEYNQNNPKMFVFSGHDYDLISLIESLKFIFNIKQYFYPKFSSSLTVELFIKNKNKINSINESDFIVKINFNGDYILEIDFDKFNKEISKNIYSKEKFNSFCKNENKNDKIVDEYFKNNKNKSINYQGYFAIIFGFLSLFEFILLYRQTRKAKIRNITNKYFNLK